MNDCVSLQQNHFFLFQNMVCRDGGPKGGGAGEGGLKIQKLLEDLKATFDACSIRDDV